MEKSSLELLEKLLDAPSPSGHEEPAQEIFMAEARKCGVEAVADVHGNVVAQLPGVSPARLLIAAHSDEIGLIVKHITDDGFLCFGAIGGVDPLILLGQRVNVLGPQGAIPGVIGRSPIHLQEPEDRDKSKIKIHDLLIDIGARNAEEAQRHAPVGTPAVWGEGFRPLLNNIAAARDFDDKAGVFVAAEAMRRLAAPPSPPPLTILFAATIQEECGVWGAGPAAYALEPIAAVAIDVTHATDYPGIEKRRHGDIRLGRGPVLHRGVKSNKALFKAFQSAAAKAQIPVQLEAESGRFGTDADPIALQRGGIPVNTLSIPLRYMHTSSETISLDDLENTVRLLTETILSLDPNMDFSPLPASLAKDRKS